MNMKKIIMLFLLNVVIVVSAYSQLFSLKQNIVMISECALTSNGFVLSGKTIQRKANNDSFFLDSKNKLFYWNDTKGKSKNDIYNFQAKKDNLKNQYVFNTVYNLVRITTNQRKEAVIEIFYLDNDRWYCLSYLCNFK